MKVLQQTLLKGIWGPSLNEPEKVQSTSQQVQRVFQGAVRVGILWLRKILFGPVPANSLGANATVYACSCALLFGMDTSSAG